MHLDTSSGLVTVTPPLSLFHLFRAFTLMMCNNVSSRPVCIDFDLLDGSSNIRRTCSLPPGQTEDMVWYFREDLWQEYGCLVRKVPLDDESPYAETSLSLLALQRSGTFPSSVSSKDIELQFLQNPQGSISFTVGSTSYILDFASAWRFHRLYGGSPTEMREKIKDQGEVLLWEIWLVLFYLAGMIQTNVTTGIPRDVCRRPKLQGGRWDHHRT